MAYTFQDFLKEELENDPEFKKEWEASQTEREMNISLIRARVAAKMTQKELSERSGINQSNISRIENGDISPNVSTLKKLAEALGTTLKIEFIPNDTSTIK